MLDEAIEYLKQLQLQVQMLTLRNGLSSRPGYSLGSLQSMLVAPAGLELDEGNVSPNANRSTDTLSIVHGRAFFSVKCYGGEHQSQFLNPANAHDLHGKHY